MPSTRSVTSERPEENKQQLEAKAGTLHTQTLKKNSGFGDRGSNHTNLDVDAIFSSVPHANDCTPDNDIFASADLETADQFPTYKSVKTVMYRKRAGRFQDFRQLNGTSNLFTIHVFIAGKLVPLVYCLTVHKDLSTYRRIFDDLILKAAALGMVLQAQTIICDFESALIPLMQRIFPRIHMQSCYSHFCKAVLWKVTDLGMCTSYIHEEQYKKKIKMLLATAFLPLHDVAAAVELLGRDVTGSVAALFNYFRVEWMPYDRLPLWNVYNVNIRTNNDLEGWHFKMNRLAGNRYLGFYELLQLLIDEQGSTETLIQRVISGCATANDLLIKNKKYEELQLSITALTAEYDGGTRTMEQFLRAVAYLVPEEENY
ncbi:hypothetical protein T07_10087 [Trichinella nelsoni]|uniref:MULE transposase domain-containing protein n=1 Tax=Trichinella nelsoni TaxID=6336 RepID=A0A0V0RED0_9BILA|nr:hypothetical protein T07_10087 [Trichinella nelsoni]